jgi:hypothetical protein
MMRRQIVLSLGGYREGIGAAEDFDLIARVSVQSKLGVVPDVLVQYRDWGNNLTARTMQELISETNTIMRYLAENCLHEAVSIDAVNALRMADWHQPLENLSQVRAAVSLLERLYHAYPQRVELSMNEVREVAEYTAVRWYLLARSCLRIAPFYALILGFKGITRSPRSVRRIVFHYVRRFLGIVQIPNQARS